MIKPFFNGWVSNISHPNYKFFISKLLPHYSLDTEVRVIDKNSALHDKIFPIIGIIKVVSTTYSHSKTVYYYEIESGGIRHALPAVKFKLHKFSKRSKFTLLLLCVGLGCLLLLTTVVFLIVV